MNKCQHPRGVTIRPDGVHELDPCVYELVEIHDNVTVHVSKCTKCGAIDISWMRKPETEDVFFEEED